MALPPDDDKLLENQQSGQQAGGTPQGGAVAGLQSGGAVAGAGPGNVSTAGIGSGGQGGWTNIQAYLNANQGQTGTGSYINDKIGGAFDQEKSKLQSDAGQAKQKSQAELGEVNMGTDAASKLIQGAATAGRDSDPYKQNTQQLKGALGATYDGPQSYSYQMQAPTAQYGSSLSAGRDGFLDSVYRDASGGRISRGQMNLQRQLDLDPTASSAIEQAQKTAMDKWAGLNTDLTNTMGETDAAVKENQKNYMTQQQQLREYLGSQATTNRAELQKLADEWQAQENRSRNSNSFEGVNPWIQDGDYTFSPEQISRLGIKAADFANYAGGGQADVRNVEGGDQYRDQWNVLQDVLGGSDLLERGAAPTHGAWNLDMAKYRDAVKAADAARIAELERQSELDVNKTKNILGSTSSSGQIF
jgi:hypothetical protein